MKWRRLAWPHSLLSYLILSFLIVILLLVSFHWLSQSIFQEKFQNEIIKYNKLNLTSTVEGYDKHLQRIENIAINLYFDEKTDVIGKNPSVANFKFLNLMHEQLVRQLSNEQLNISNLIVYYGHAGVSIDKEGVRTGDNLFSYELVSESYGYSFWREQLPLQYRYRMLPAATFQRYQSVNRYSDPQELLPIIFKNILSRKMYIVALLDAQGLFRSFHHASDTPFYIADPDGKVMFRSPAALQAELPEIGTTFPNSEGYVRKGGDFYFYKKGANFPFIYVSVVPNEAIAEQVRRMNVESTVLLGIVAVFSIFIAVALSLKINNPVRQIMQTVERPEPRLPSERGIREMNIIRDTLNSFISQKSLIVQYGYMNRLKNIYNRLDDVQEDLRENELPFYLVVFSVFFPFGHHRSDHPGQSAAVHRLNEFVRAHISGVFAKAVTFQMENDQIISLIFVDGHGEPEEVLHVLRTMKAVFDADGNCPAITIAVNPVLQLSSHFSQAYAETLEMLQQRDLTGRTQLISHSNHRCFQPLLYPTIEKEFYHHLQAGNETEALQIFQRMLQKSVKKGANVYQFMQFSREIVAGVIRTLSKSDLDLEMLYDEHSPYQRLKACMTENDFSRFFERFIHQAVRCITEKKRDKDQLKDAIVAYLHRHYTVDISLESVANHFNISSGYLSIYFKEKTGINFLSYLHSLRLETAKEQLLGTRMSVREIGVAIGFQNTNSFTRLFKKMTGVSPGEFRRLHAIGETNTDLHG